MNRSPTPISRTPLGRPGVAELPHEALSRIIASPGLPILDSSRQSAEDKLKRALLGWLRESLKRPLRKEEYRKLKKHFQGCVEAYAALSRQLHQAVYFPPTPPDEEWLRHSRNWFDKIESFYESGKGQGRPLGTWEAMFYPEALRLFVSIYGVAPTSTTAVEGSNAGARCTLPDNPAGRNAQNAVGPSLCRRRCEEQRVGEMARANSRSAEGTYCQRDC